MSLPVSQYEALLAEVKGLRRKTQRVQQLANAQYYQNEKPLDYTMESLLLNRQHNRSHSPNYERGATSDQDHLSSEDEFRSGIPKARSAKSVGRMSVSSEPVTRVTSGQPQIESMYHGAWPNVERTSMWNSEPASLGEAGAQQQRKLSSCSGGYQNEVSSVMSFASSSGGVPIDRALCDPRSSQQSGAKVDVVNNLLAMLSSQEHVDMGETLLALSSCPESCLAMRQSGCIPLLVQLVQSDKDVDTRKKAAQALHNLVNSQPDEKIRKREIRILKLLEDTRRYIECLKYDLEFEMDDSIGASMSPVHSQDDGDKHPVQLIAHLMKLSFDEGHRQAICQLGGIHTVATLVETEHGLHGSSMQDGHCLLMRRYACMALTNLTFGDSGNKTLLCSFKEFMKSLILQLQSPSDELRQVTASVLRNLSWRADSTSKEILREVGSVTGLMKAAMLQNKENTLKSILSALWNLSAHCTEHKSEICAVDGGLGFLVNMLTYKTPSKSLAIIENAGGILRNISSQIAVRDDYREILRKHNCLHILLDQLKSPSLTIVSNACGTLWNLSAKNAQDQDTLWQMGAPAMLRSLNHSKHKIIAMGSSAALKNLLGCRPQQSLVHKLDSTALSLNLPELPTLGARKQKALMQELDHNLTETYENIDKDSPVKSTASSADNNFTRKSNTDLTNQFASLNLNEPSTSYALDARHKTKIAQNYAGSSLPYVPQPTKRSNPTSFLPVRKYPEDGTHEQPIDYSRKYTSTEQKEGYSDKKDSDSFGIGYTETDLDQPTDYSLRYAEDDSDSESCSNKMTKEYVPDTVKTYCTEGTPYETPFAFSTATSMSDLRNVGATDDKPEIIDNDLQKENDKKDNKETKNVDEKDRCSTEDISEMDNVQIKEKSEFSSGVMSPDKPINYCDEGTPGCFSRFGSFQSGLNSIPANETTVIKKQPIEEKSEFSSGVRSPDKLITYCDEGTPGACFSRFSSFESGLNSIPANESVIKDQPIEEKYEVGAKLPDCDEETPPWGFFSRFSSFKSGSNSIPANETDVIKKEPKEEAESLNNESPPVQKTEKPSSEKISSSTPKMPNETKAVKFEQVVDYAEQTPLMFSRSSSLASLDSIEQHSIHDDRSSVVSDFSRLTSGLVSPSDLPDSPTQTVPSSPRPGKQKLEFPSSSKNQPPRRHSAETKQQKLLSKATFFEDSVIKFNEESTPIQFSTATSLSSLNHEDGEPPTKTPKTKVVQSTSAANASTKDEQGEQQEKADTEKEKETSGSDDLNDDSDGDDDILAACINDGMQSNISAPTVSSAPTKLPTFKYQPAKMPGTSTGIPMKRRTPPRHLPVRNTNLDEPTRAYCTEDAPLNRVGSNSNLSELSIPTTNKSKTGDFSDDSSNLSGDNENLLEQCIQSGMPKAKEDPKASQLLANKNKATDLSDDSSNLSGDNENLLEECIKSGMPKGKKDPPKIPTLSVLPRRALQPPKQQLQRPQSLENQTASSSIAVRKSDETLKAPRSYSNYNKQRALEKIDSNRRKGCEKNAEVDRRETSLPPYLRDEIVNYQVEDSPFQYSLRSSLSDLTVDGSEAGLKLSVKTQKLPTKEELGAAAGPSRKHLPSDTNKSPPGANKANKLQRKESFSSVSSMASNESDQALLEECIYSGMPSDKNEEALLDELIQAGMPQSRTSSRNDTSSRPVPNTRPLSQRDEFLAQTQNAEASNRSKNVNAASVVESTAVARPLANLQRPEKSNTAAGVGKGPAPDRSDQIDEEKGAEVSSCSVRTATTPAPPEDQKTGTRPPTDMLPGRFLPSDENFSTDQMKSGSSKSVSQFLEGSFENDFTYSNSDNCANLDHAFTKSCEESGNLVDNRMLDPDAMIESLDRFTAELVSQASHLTREKNNSQKSKLSNNDDNTWNDDISHNEITFPTLSESVPNVITFEDDSSNIDVVDAVEIPDEGISNDFSSLNTTTMTESTLIAIEANKMVTVFKKEAEMSLSTISAKSLDLDSVKPPSQLNSLANSITSIPRSPKLTSRKKSLPGSLLVKRALNNSMNPSSSMESLDNNIEALNPPSEMFNLDMDTSITSIASLPSESPGKIQPHPIFTVKQQFFQAGLNSLNADLEMVNPPSIFNDITDMCNSLADVATDIIGTETSIFQDCFTQAADNTYVDNTLENDTTEFSDANSVTPIQTDISSAENTPKRTPKTLNKTMMTKQKRNMARDRYKTYVVAAEKVMQESIELEKGKTLESPINDISEELSEDYVTVNDQTEPRSEATYTVESPQMTPKERRRLDRARFETQVLDETTILLSDLAVKESGVECGASSASPSPTRSKLSIRRNFLQKRLENKERFRTQTLSESSFGSPEPASASPCENSDIHSLVEKEANLVLKTIRDSKLFHDDLLDCETLSLVSNDEDSEHNSVNYRTYHRSWSSKKTQDLPVISVEPNGHCVVEEPTLTVKSPVVDSESNSDEENLNVKVLAKPKIVKPSSLEVIENVEIEEEPKGIRGRRKPLYSKSNLNNKVSPKTIKPAKNMASNLVKNITSSLKSGTALSPRDKGTTVAKPAIKSSGYGYNRSNNNGVTPNRSVGNSSPKHIAKGSPPLERQGTFTKDDCPSNAIPKTPTRLPTPSSKIPSFARQIARAVTSKIPTNNNATPNKSPSKSLSADRTSKISRIYNRSTSADSREPSNKKIQPSSSTQSLKNESKIPNGALKKSGIPGPAQRSHSNVSVSSNGSAKKQVTSKIASLWKRVEESKAKQQPKPDKRVWIQSEKEPEPPKLIRSDTFENKDGSVACALEQGIPS